MTDKLKPTAEQIQRACDLAGEHRSAYYGIRRGLAALADTIAELDAEKQISADTLARAEKAEADLAEIDRLLIDGRLTNDGNVQDAADIAAPYKVEADPLVELMEEYRTGVGDSVEAAAYIRAELAKRGLEIGRSA